MSSQGAPAKTVKKKPKKRENLNAVAPLTGDPVRMYLKEIGKVPLPHRRPRRSTLAMKIEAGLEAGARIDRRPQPPAVRSTPAPEKRRVVPRMEPGRHRCQAAARRG